jgi:hypothetical protein
MKYALVFLLLFSNISFGSEEEAHRFRPVSGAGCRASDEGMPDQEDLTPLSISVKDTKTLAKLLSLKEEIEFSLTLSLTKDGPPKATGFSIAFTWDSANRMLLDKHKENRGIQKLAFYIPIPCNPSFKDGFGYYKTEGEQVWSVPTLSVKVGSEEILSIKNQVFPPDGSFHRATLNLLLSFDDASNAWQGNLYLRNAQHQMLAPLPSS